MPNTTSFNDNSMDTTKRLILIPVRSFDVGKSRLAGISEVNRRRFLTDLAHGVISELATISRRVVVTTSDEVAEWASQLGCLTLTTSSPLNVGLSEALEEFGSEGGYGVVMGDIALPSRTSLAAIISRPTPIVTCDRLYVGTSILSIPTSEKIDFKFGNGSFKSHLTEVIKHFGIAYVGSPSKETVDIDSFEDLLCLQSDKTLSLTQRLRIETMIKLAIQGVKNDI